MICWESFHSPCLAHFCRTSLLMLPPEIRFLIPCQYKILYIATVRPGIHGIWPAWIFLHCFSASIFAAVIVWSIDSSMSNCHLVRVVTPSLYIASSCGRLCWVVIIWARCLLYFLMILRSWHLSLLPAGLVMSPNWSIPSLEAWMSSQITWWLLIITSPKARNPPRASSKSVLEMKIPSITLLPLWCVGTDDWLCKLVIASTKLVVLQNCIMSLSKTLSFMLANTITSSPSSVHRIMSWLRSWRNLVLGHVHVFCFDLNWTCCWYVVTMLSDLAGWYANTSHNILLFLPCKHAQHHLPNPSLSLLGCCALCDSWLSMTNAVPPGWYNLFLVYCLWCSNDSHQNLVCSTGYKCAGACFQSMLHLVIAHISTWISLV